MEARLRVFSAQMFSVETRMYSWEEQDGYET